MDELFPETMIFPVKLVWPKGQHLAKLIPVSDQCPLVLDSSGDANSFGPTVLLDFGKELFGGVQFDVARVGSRDRTQLRVRLGESVSEAIAGSFVDRTLEIGKGQAHKIGTTGFRFARIDLVEEAASAELTGLKAYSTACDLEAQGAFRCNDELLNQIWDAGAYTVRLCMQDLLWDGIKRGRSVWAGDLYPAANVVAAVFGDHPIVPASLNHVRDKSLFEGTRAPAWMNGIPAYSLWWLIVVDEWYLHQGQQSFLESQRDYLLRLMPVIFENIDKDGRERMEGWRFLDWATTHDQAAIDCGYQGLTAWALQSAARLFKALGEETWHDRCMAEYGRLARHSFPATPSKQASALMSLGGLTNPDETNRAILSQDPTWNLTPFLGYAGLQARAQAGDFLGGMNLIRTYWGVMIRCGATTFWEDFDLEWVSGSAGIDEIVPETSDDIHADFGRCTYSGLGQSLCHGWSAGATAWLSQHVLGVTPITAGCRSVRVTPHLGDLQWVSGQFPTPHGVIRIEHQMRADGTVESVIDAPPTVEVIRG